MRYLFDDPRPDLEQDTNLWIKLLRGAAYLEDREIAFRLSKRLWTMRCIGTQLKPTREGMKFIPIIEPEGLWPSQEWFDEFKLRDLKPYKNEIQFLIDRAEGRVIDG